MCAIIGFTTKSRSREEVQTYLDRTRSRGPDMARILETPSGWLGFRRLAIMGLDESGMQPFVRGKDMAVCNGELYGFRPIREKINYEALRSYIVSTTKAAYKVFLLWCALIAAIGILYGSGVIDGVGLFMISVVFYVCDLICVLIWCPFRLIMKNRCCTTCRIFNWDHLMMFSPLIFLGGFYAGSLVLLSAVAWLVWELCVMMYPERFWDHSNAALQCSACTDKLCTQYCRKLRDQER